MDNVLLPHETTHIEIDGVAVGFNVLNGQLISITKESFSDMVSSFITRWDIKENTENAFSVVKYLLSITTPDDNCHECTFIIESMQEADTRIETVICELLGINALERDYLPKFGADIGREEIKALITEAILGDSSCETWVEYKFSFVIIEREDA
ncbi:MAG: hypothetical protein ACI92O_000441 [Colwellia sp.]|jgi:hypothetical protein